MVRQGIRSLDLLVDEVRVEREAQLRHFDALDQKAGIVLGFAGVLVVLSPGGRHFLVDIGRLVAVLSGVFALWTFWPRRVWVTDLRQLRDLYLAAEPQITKLRLLDTQIDMAHSVGGVLLRKARRLKASMALLLFATLFTTVG
jgi:hypothetical protein